MPVDSSGAIAPGSPAGRSLRLRALCRPLHALCPPDRILSASRPAVKKNPARVTADRCSRQPPPPRLPPLQLGHVGDSPRAGSRMTTSRPSTTWRDRREAYSFKKLDRGRPLARRRRGGRQGSRVSSRRGRSGPGRGRGRPRAGDEQAMGDAVNSGPAATSREEKELPPSAWRLATSEAI